MAIFRTVLGTFRNKLGNIITYTWSGDAMARSFPLKVTNPKTVGQQNQRARFHCLSAMSAWMVDVLELGFGVRPKRWTLRNSFLHYNNEAVSVGDGGVCTVDYANLKVSEGSLIQATYSLKWNDAEHLFNLSYTKPTYTLTDKEKGYNLYAVLLESTLEETFIKPVGTLDNSIEVELEVPETWNKDEVKAYAVVRDEKTKKCSNSSNVVIA